MKKYEYTVVTIATAFAMNTKQYEKMALDFETQLNELGREGWFKEKTVCFSLKENFNDNLRVY